MGPEARRPYIESARNLNAGRIEPTFCSSKSIAESPVSDLAGKFDSLGRSYLAIRNKAVQEKSKEISLLVIIIACLENYFCHRFGKNDEN